MDECYLMSISSNTDIFLNRVRTRKSNERFVRAFTHLVVDRGTYKDINPLLIGTTTFMRVRVLTCVSVRACLVRCRVRFEETLLLHVPSVDFSYFGINFLLLLFLLFSRVTTLNYFRFPG